MKKKFNVSTLKESTLISNMIKPFESKFLTDATLQKIDLFFGKINFWFVASVKANLYTL